MDIIAKKIQELTDETGVLVYKRDSMVNEIKQIDVRLTQLIGALETLHKLQKEIEQSNEASNDSQSKVPESPSKPTEEPGTDQDGLQAEGDTSDSESGAN